MVGLRSTSWWSLRGVYLCGYSDVLPTCTVADPRTLGIQILRLQKNWRQADSAKVRSQHPKSKAIGISMPCLHLEGSQARAADSEPKHHALKATP